MADIGTLREKQRLASAPAEVSVESDPLNQAAERQRILKSLPKTLVRKAWFNMAHLIVEPGAVIADMGCGSGAVTYAMAALNPRQHFIGVTPQPETFALAQEKYDLPNLEYRLGDVRDVMFEENSLDAIINSFMLHEVYSAAGCNDWAVIETLEAQLRQLKKGGQLFLRDHVMPSEDFVLMEMPDVPSRGDSIMEMSEADLLIHYAEEARTRHASNYRGFYLEELPARFPHTRLFRVPAKWAHEFILRKDDRDIWEEELYKEYTFFTEREFRWTMRGMGARVLYSAPHWDEQIVRKRFDKKFRLFDEHGNSLGSPPTSFIALFQKVGDNKSLVLQERKPVRGKKENQNLRLMTMRDEVDGTIVDVVSRGLEVTEVIPYRITEDGHLNVFVHEGLPRGLVNAVQRSGVNIDRKKWSGHMIEAIAVPQEILHGVMPHDIARLKTFGHDYLGLQPTGFSTLENGPGFYPAPDCVDERIETKYMRVEKPAGQIKPLQPLDEIKGFSTQGFFREIDAQEILNAIGVGLIPSSRLELQILALFEKLEMPYDSWADCPLVLEEAEFEEKTSYRKIIEKLNAKDDRFKEIKGTAGQLRTVNSVFVDEGRIGGGLTGLASRTMEFVVHEEKTQNIAVVLPLARSINGEVMAGICEQYLPVPQRYKGNGYVVSCPSFSLPKEITNMELAQKYIAEKFEVPIECVARMGESFFSHIGVMPQRIYPFAVTKAGAKGWQKIGRQHGVTNHAPLYDLHKLLYWDNHYSFMKVVAMAYKSIFGLSSDLSPDTKFDYSRAEQKAKPISLKGITTYDH